MDVIYYAHPVDSVVLLSDVQYAQLHQQLEAMGVKSKEWLNKLASIEKKKEKNIRVSI